MAKPPIPRGYLARKGYKARGVSLLDLATLLSNARLALSDPEIGWGGVRESYEMVKNKLNAYRYVEPEWLESLLWAANMLDEKQLFWDHSGRSFDQFLRDVIRRGEYDKTFNYIKEKQDDKRNNSTRSNGDGQPEGGGSDHSNGPQDG